jgi:hypothetical protein
MLRVFTFTLALVALMPATTHAVSRLDPPARGIETALYQSAAAAGRARLAERVPVEAMQLQVGGALALTQPSLRASFGGHGTRRYLSPHRLSGRPPADPPAVVRWLDLRGSRPALAYPVTEWLSLGLRYTFQRGEDLNFKAAKTGSLHDDYASHRVLLRAQWEF